MQDRLVRFEDKQEVYIYIYRYMIREAREVS